jgi:hypothetical protein
VLKEVSDPIVIFSAPDGLEISRVRLVPGLVPSHPGYGFAQPGGAACCHGVMEK